jgi:hypothetical protein
LRGIISGTDNLEQLDNLVLGRGKDSAVIRLKDVGYVQSWAAETPTSIAANSAAAAHLRVRSLTLRGVICGGKGPEREGRKGLFQDLTPST